MNGIGHRCTRMDTDKTSIGNFIRIRVHLRPSVAQISFVFFVAPVPLPLCSRCGSIFFRPSQAARPGCNCVIGPQTAQAEV